MKKNKYKIYESIKKYKNFFGKKLIIVTDGGELNLYFNKSRFGHMLGLHYLDGKHNESYYIDKILKSKINDYKIMNRMENKHPELYDFIPKRLIKSDFFLRNIENCKISKSSHSKLSKLKCEYIIYRKDPKNKKDILQLGIKHKNDFNFDIETFLVRSNTNNINHYETYNILGIYEELDNGERKPFSFNEEKQRKLDIIFNNENLKDKVDYKDVINKSLEDLIELDYDNNNDYIQYTFI